MGTIPIPKFTSLHDPNALIGPAGYGTQGFLQPIGPWPYTVDFENDGGRCAGCHCDRAGDANLDWSTFQLGSFGFGPIMSMSPPG